MFKLLFERYYQDLETGNDNSEIYGEFLKGIMRVSANGGTPEPLIRTPIGIPERPQILPIEMAHMASTGWQPMDQAKFKNFALSQTDF